MDEARSLTYSINVKADTAQAEADIRNLVGNLGGAQQSHKIDISADTSQAESNIRNVIGDLGDLQSQRVDVQADTSQAESGLRNLADSMGKIGSQADSMGSAFRKSFLAGIDSGNSFTSSLKAGVGGAFTHVADKVNDFKTRVVQGAQSIKDGFTHPIETLKSGFGGAIESVQGKFVKLVRGADDAADVYAGPRTGGGHAVKRR